MSPTLSASQAANASERRTMSETAEEVRRRQYIEVARATGAPAHLVAEVVTEWQLRHPVAAPAPEKPGPPKPTLDTELIRNGKVKTIALHLVAIRALVGLLDPETRERATSALQTTEEALVAWEEVQNG